MAILKQIVGQYVNRVNRKPLKRSRLAPFGRSSKSSSLMHPTSLRLTFMRSAFISALVVALASCGSNPTKPSEQTITPAETSRQDVETLLSNAERLQALGDQAGAAEAKLEAGQLMVEFGEFNTASRVFADIDYQQLPPHAAVNYTLAYSDLCLRLGDYFVAKRILGQFDLNALQHTLTVDQELHWRGNIARVYEVTDDPVLAIKEYLALAPLLLSDTATVANNERIWRLLSGLPQSTLNALSENEPSQLLRGWYSLAAISKNNQYNIEQQLQQIRFWQQTWPQHPASQSLPQDLQLLQQLVLNQPKQVALLLPLTGKFGNAGNAVREGFMSAYYAAAQSGHEVPRVQLYNTDGANINLLYDQAVAEGAETVIGPLQKAPLDELNLRPALPVPTLALNYIVGESLVTDNLYQFGLAVEDEARQIAERAWRDGHRRAMILSSDRDWGDRSADAFALAWTELGGSLAVASEFAQQGLFSQIVEQSLLVDRSKQRGRKLEQLLGMNLETEPRSRQDIDMIFMVANPEDARQLKPILEFHYAANIPVYATGHIYDPNARTADNNDLNGIRFTTLPWYFGFSKPERTLLDDYVSHQKHLQSIHALGVDAYRLYPRLLQFQNANNTRYYGATGELFLTSRGRIAREQSLAIISGGKALVVPTVADGTVIN